MIEFLRQYGILCILCSFLICALSEFVKRERRKSKDKEDVLVYFAKEDGDIDYTFVTENFYEENRHKYFKDKNDKFLCCQAKGNYEEYAIKNNHYVFLGEQSAKIVKQDGESDLVVYCKQQIKKVRNEHVTFCRELNYSYSGNEKASIEQPIGQTVYFIEGGNVYSGFILAVSAMDTIIKHGDTIKAFYSNEVFFDELEAKDVLDFVNNPKPYEKRYIRNEKLTIKLLAEKANRNE